jgi:hypothetical protein
MSVHDDDPPDPRFVALYEGEVVDNLDPKLMGRIRILIPGLLEPSGWTMPIAMPGGGADNRGHWQVPRIGANVAVLFVQGDVDHPRYLAGPWASPRATGTEIPNAVRTLTPAEAVEVAVIQTRRWEIVFDDRIGRESLRIKDLEFDEDVLEIDGANHGVTISGTAAVVIRSRGVVNIEALQIMLNGRVVRETEDPI